MQNNVVVGLIFLKVFLNKVTDVKYKALVFNYVNLIVLA